MQTITSRPYFLWDYDLSEADVQHILQGENETEKVWLMSRILESARYEDVWKYMTLAQLRRTFPKLQLKPQVREVWAFALQVWAADDLDEQ